MRTAVMVVGLLVAACAGLGGAAVSLLRPVVVGPVAPVVVPSAILAGVSPSDAKLLRDFHAAMADIVVRDGQSPDPVVKKIFDLRNRYRFALQMAFANTGMVGKYPELGGKLDAYLLEAVGKTDAELTPAVRASAAKAFAEIR